MANGDFHGYMVIEVVTALSGAQKIKLRDTLLGMGRQSDPNPCYITHHRPRTDNQAMLVEITVPASLSKADIVNALATALGVSVATLNANLNYTLFAGGDWETRRQACVAYLGANQAAWGEG
jgi:hypothetical protein